MNSDRLEVGSLLPTVGPPCDVWRACRWLVLVMTVCSGCSFWQVPHGWPLHKDPPPVPARIVPMWSDTVMYQPGLAGVRGFGARIYFYADEENSKPLKVDGTLTIYAFDANDKARMPLPEKKFVFTPEQLARHHSVTSIGDSYSIWLPWDEVGGPTRQLSLVTRFEGSTTGTLVSEPVRKLLPGAAQDTESLARDATPAVRTAAVGDRAEDANGTARRANYDGADGERPRQVTTALLNGNLARAPAERGAPEMKTITIEVPPSFSRKLGPRPASTDPSSASPHDATFDANDLTPGGASSSAAQPTSDATARDSEWEQAEAQGALSYHQRLATHFAQRKSPARSQPVVRPTGAAPRRQPRPATWLPGLPPTPRSSATPDASDE